MAVPRGPSQNEPASLNDIQVEFGGANPIGLNEYYAGGANVSNPPPTSGFQSGPVPTSGAISIGNFLGLTKHFVFNDVVSVNTSNYVLRDRAIFAGWNGVVPLKATITINNGVYVFASSTANHAFSLGTMSSGTTIILYNSGAIVGRGGNGGAGGFGNGSANAGGAGGGGGPALIATYPMSIYNYNTIGGGGGGGGGSYSNAAFNGSKQLEYTGGGGGGGGMSLGAGGAGGGAAGGSGGNYPGQAGGNAGFGNAGAGGLGGVAPSNSAGNGGAGGTLGAGGAAGASSGGGAGGAGGGAGAAINGNGNISWFVFGSRLGAIG